MFCCHVFHARTPDSFDRKATTNTHNIDWHQLKLNNDMYVVACIAECFSGSEWYNFQLNIVPGYASVYFIYSSISKFTYACLTICSYTVMSIIQLASLMTLAACC